MQTDALYAHAQVATIHTRPPSLPTQLNSGVAAVVAQRNKQQMMISLASFGRQPLSPCLVRNGPCRLFLSVTSIHGPTDRASTTVLFICNEIQAESAGTALIGRRIISLWKSCRSCLRVQIVTRSALLFCSRRLQPVGKQRTNLDKFAERKYSKIEPKRSTQRP